MTTTPKTLFHCTTIDRLKPILAEGLVPKKSKSSLQAVFLSNCRFLAIGYAGQRPDKRHVLLAIEVSSLDLALLGPDNVELQDWLEDEENEHDASGVMHWRDASWMQSLEWCNQVAYYGVIPPSAISVVERIEHDRDSSMNMEI